MGLVLKLRKKEPNDYMGLIFVSPDGLVEEHKVAIIKVIQQFVNLILIINNLIILVNSVISIIF